MEVPQIKDILKKLSKIQDMYKFDPDILSQDPQRTFPTNWNSVDMEQLSHLKNLYSVTEITRNKAFKELIEQPLLNILCDIGHVCVKLSENAKRIAQFSYLQIPGVIAQDDGLCEMAIRDIFSDPTNGLSALRGAIEALQKDPKTFGEAQLESLGLFRSFAGFYCDQKVVQKLIELSRFIPQSNPADQHVRLAILMFLQVAGEHFDRLLSGTLRIAEDIPDTVGDDLRTLRNTLSRMSQSKLDKILRTSDDTTEKFRNVQKDIERLRANLQRIHKWYEEMRQKSPADLWSQVKKFAIARPCDKVSRYGFKDLSDFLEPVKVQQSDDDHLFYDESDVFFSSSRDLVMVQQFYLKQRNDLMRVLKCEKNAEKTPESLLEDLKKDVSGISAKSLLTIMRCDTFLKSLTRLEKEKIQYFKDEMQTEGHEKVNEQTTLKFEFIDELLNVSRDDHKKIEEHAKKLTESKDQIRTLLLKQHQEACGGYGNISEKYKEFCEMLKTVISDPDDDPQFSWTSEPISNIEKLFHKVHKTGIFTKAGKDALRRTRILQMLTMVDSLREMVGIKADIALVIKKNAYDKIMENKTKLMEKAISSLVNQPDAIGKLCDLQERFSNIRHQLVHSDTVSDVPQLIDEAKTHREELLQTLEAITADQLAPSVDIKSLKEELAYTSRDEFNYDLEYHSEATWVRDVDRNHPSVVENAKKIMEFFKTYAERSGQTLQPCAQHMEYALKSVDDYQKEKSQQLRRLHDKFLGTAKQLLKVDATEEAKTLIDDAIKTQDDFDKQLESVKSDHWCTVTYLSVRDTCKEKLTAIRQEYHTTLLPYNSHCDLEYQHKNELLKNDDHNHPSVKVNATKIKEFFKDYAESSEKTLQHYAQHMEDALKSVDDYQKEKSQQLRRLHDKFLGFAEQLMTVDAIEEAKTLIDEAIKTEDEFDKQLESVKSDHSTTVTSLSVRDTCKKKLTGILQEYHTEILAYQFVVATIYDMLSQIFDYPELDLLKDIIQVRHHYFHCILFDEMPLVIGCGRTMDISGRNQWIETSRPSTREGQLAKEISYLTVVFKFYLNDLADCLSTK